MVSFTKKLTENPGRNNGFEKNRHVFHFRPFLSKIDLISGLNVEDKGDFSHKIMERIKNLYEKVA